MINLTIRDRTGKIFESPVKAVSSYNASGRFDVLENHISYLTTIEKELIVLEENDREKKYPLQHGGFIMAHQNNINVVVGT